MNKLNIINNRFTIGDSIQLLQKSGNFIEGIILDVNEDFIEIKNDEGELILFESGIDGFQSIHEKDKEIEIVSMEEESNNTDQYQGGNEITHNTEEEEEEPIIDSEELELEENGRILPGIKVIKKINETDLIINTRINQYAVKNNIPLEILINTLEEECIYITKHSIITSNIANVIFNNSILKRIREKIEKQNEQKEKERIKKIKTPRKFENLSDLSSIKEEFEIEESKKLIPANAIITSYFESNKFGTVLFNDKVFRFKFLDIKDEELKTNLKGNKTNENIPIICFVNYSNKTASFIHSPMSIEVCLGKIDILILAKDLSTSKKLLNILLLNYPSNQKALSLKRSLNRNRDIKRKSFDFHQKALNTRNTTEKIELFKKSIEIKEARARTSIYHLVLLLIKNQQLEEAITVLSENKRTITARSLAFLSLSAKDYKSCIKYSDDEIDKIDKKQLTPYSKLEKGKFLLFKSQAYAMLGDMKMATNCYNEGEKLVDFGFANYIKKLLVRLKDGETINEEDLYTFHETDSVNIEIPKIIKDKIKNCKYEGMSDFQIKKKNFKRTDIESLEESLKGVKSLQEKSERAITIIKLFQEIEPDNSTAIFKFISMSSYYQADNFFNAHINMDVVRTFFLYSLKYNKYLDENLKKSLFWLYILSMFNNPETRSEFMLSTWTDGEKQKVFESLFKNFDKIFHYLLYAVSCKGFINQFIKLVSSNFEFSILNNKEESNTKTFLIQMGLLEKETLLTIENFKEILLIESEKYKNKLKINNIKYSDILKKETPNDIFQSLVMLYKEDENTSVLMEKDKDALKTICDDSKGGGIFTEYLKAEIYDDKERLYNQVDSFFNNLLEEIRAYPTEFTFEYILPIIDKFIELLELDFVKFKESSLPNIEISLQNISNPDYDNYIKIELQISNGIGCSTVRGLEFNIENGLHDEYTIVSNPMFNETLRGGDNEVISFDLKISETTIQKEIFDLNCSYTYDDIEEDIYNNMSLSVSKNEFIKIENPYGALANGKAVDDPDMFFGRDNTIKDIKEDILSNSQTKGIAIYGQKRSGKSSVLNFLEKSLIENKECICASFSMGSVMGNPDAEFLWMLHKEIHDAYNNEIDDTQEKLSRIPFNDFNTPLFWEFMDKVKEKIRENFNGIRLVVLIDEFTYIYSEIKNPESTLNNNFMLLWKSILEKGYFSCVLIGQDVMPKFKDEFKNELGMIETIRLSDISEESAIDLITNPILDVKGNSRMLENVPKSIYDFTTCNPFYLIIFMDRLVKYMNSNKFVKCSKGIVDRVKNELINGNNKLTIQDFDGLINAGDDHFKDIKDEQVIRILQLIAIGTKVVPTIHVRDIEKNLEEEFNVKEILKSLDLRGVIEKKEYKYKIKSVLFKNWLNSN